MQHTNIVPIYSFHRAGPFQAVCMPYFGRTTLAQIVKHLGGRAGLPSSGRELRSTVCHHGSGTVPPAGSSHLSMNPAPTPAPGELPPVPLQTVTPDHTADGWTRLEGLSYVEAVLCLGGQLAEGLAHAHQRGILHLDLKPANVLLTDDGRPMLLDFNLAEDTKGRGAAERAAVGGTLPYMAPEQLRAYRDRTGSLDGRCDVYSLGVILFELLTGRHPFPTRKGTTRDVIPDLLADREKSPPSVRTWNRAVSPAAEAIVRKCLAADPAERYRSAEDLREDIDRHLNHRPLKHAPNPSSRERARKWVKRHPRLASSGTVGAVAAALLLALGLGALHSRERARDLYALTQFADHQIRFRDAQLFLDDRNQSRTRLDEAAGRLRTVLDRYGVPDDGSDGWLAGSDAARLPEAERGQLRADVGETFYMMAQVAYLQALGADDPAHRAARLEQAARWNAGAGRYAGDRLPRSIREQLAAVAELRGGRAEAERLRGEASRVPLDSPRDLYLLGSLLTQKGRHRDALPHLRRSTQLDPKNFSAWFVRGTTHLALEHNDAAVACFSACLALRDDFAPAWLNRGLALSRLRAFDQACDDYDRAIGLDPDLVEAYVQRATARAAVDDLKGAEADLARALATGVAPVRVYFLRAGVRDRLGDKAGARADREAGLRLTPGDELSWVGRAETRLTDDPKGALADVEEALKLNPFSMFALQLKAHILAERLDRPDDALTVLKRAVELHPDYVPARAGRGVLLARRGKRDEAVRDAREALLRDTRAPNLYQVACIYALTSKEHPEDKVEAFRLLSSALRTGFGLDLVDTDPDLDTLRKDPEFKRMVSSARDHHAARGVEGR
jgi:tetratricopeptide (TPR) repeat protein